MKTDKRKFILHLEREGGEPIVIYFDELINVFYILINGMQIFADVVIKREYLFHDRDQIIVEGYVGGNYRTFYAVLKADELEVIE